MVVAPPTASVARSKATKLGLAAMGHDDLEEPMTTGKRRTRDGRINSCGGGKVIWGDATPIYFEGK